MSAPPISRRQFDDLLRPHRGSLLQFAQARCGTDPAEDLVQTALCCAWSQITRFDTDTGAPGLLRWLMPFLFFACADYLRRVNTRREILLPMDEILSLAETAAEALPDLSGALYQARREELDRLMERVSMTARQEVCIRHWRDGATQETIAQFLQISQEAVRQHIAAGVAKLSRQVRVTVSIEVLEVFEETLREARELTYHTPGVVWDREGLAEKIQARRTVTAQERYEERQAKKWTRGE